MAAIQKYGFQLVEVPPYVPDIAPSDYIKELGGHHFTRDDVMNAVDHFLRDQNGVFYKDR